MTDHQQRIHPVVDVKAPPTPPLVPHGSSTSEKGSPVRRRPLLLQHAIPVNPVTPQIVSTGQFGVRSRGVTIPMVDHQQRIHPVVDVEAPPTIPLVPHGSSTSEKGSPVHRRRPPLLQHAILANLAAARPPKNNRSCTFCKCICWSISLLLLLVIIVGATAGILYLVFQPKIPTYSIDSLNISNFGLNFDMSLYAVFDVKVSATNPNKKIGIYYEKGGRLSVWYTNTKLCDGSLPVFYQGHQNKTVFHVALTGKTQYGSTLMAALQEQQQTGRIPLDLKVDAPVAIKLGKLKLKKVGILGECLLIVDNLSANNAISIKASDCKFRLKL